MYSKCCNIEDIEKTIADLKWDNFQHELIIVSVVPIKIRRISMDYFEITDVKIIYQLK